MDKNEILRKFRNENKQLDEAQLQALFQGGYVSYYFGLFLCATVQLLNNHFHGPQSVRYTAWLILFGMSVTNFATIAKKSGKKHYRILSILSALLCVLDFWKLVSHLVAGT